MQDLSQNELEQIAKTRRFKNYKSMSREDLLIANQSHAELRKSEDNNVEIFLMNQKIGFQKKKSKKLEENFVLEKGLMNI